MSGIRGLFQGKKETEEAVDKAVQAINEGNDVYSNLVYLNDLYSIFPNKVVSTAIPACAKALKENSGNAEIMLVIFSIFNSILTNSDPQSRIIIETDYIISSLLKYILEGTVPCQIAIFKIFNFLATQNRELFQDKLFEEHDQFISLL